MTKVEWLHDIRWGERFVEIYEERDDGKLQVDYGRIHDTEPVPTVESNEEIGR